MRLTDALWSPDPKTRIRLKQWAVSLAMYAGSAFVMLPGVPAGLIDAMAVAGWMAFVGIGSGVFYALIRSGWSRRLEDPALTQCQSMFAVLTVMWGYVMSNEVRSATLFPLTVILTFGAFSLTWQRMAWLTVLTLLILTATMVGMHWARPGELDVRVDVANLLIMTVMLPGASVIASLLGALRSRLREQRNELTAALVTIQDLATHDELTGLINRRHMQHLLEAEERRGDRLSEPFTVALIDLDHFKRINDTYGHAVGDEVLRAFAAEARAAMRVYDMVARWGGEEFLVLMPATDAGDALLAVERLLEQVRQLRVQVASLTLNITCSAGMAEHQPGETVSSLLMRADKALYAAKHAGRDRVAAASMHYPVHAGSVLSS